ncbi:MAG TPA: hypothetical protein VG347_01160, partial [Verrucomicrobiae bacterium]|nr:hypothetical protein [Verrucomicrobiae bacterium]
METLGRSRLKTFLEEGWQENDITNSIIRGDSGLTISTFPELVKNIAQLSYYNRDQVLLFRGQQHDFKNLRGN